MMPKKEDPHLVARFAGMLSAMGTGPRLRIVRLLLSAHPQGMVVGEIADELAIPASTLSHHLEKLKNEDLVRVRREGTFLWYSANTQALEDLLGFLYAECCTRNKAVEPRNILCCRSSAVKSSAVKSSAVKSSAVKSPAVKSSSVKSSAAIRSRS